MLNSVVARRLLRLSQQRGLLSARAFSTSALLVPLQEGPQLPHEIANGALQTEAALEALQQEFREFNLRCADELKEMNQNQITNIIERGGVEGWDTVSFIIIHTDLYRLLTSLT